MLGKQIRTRMAPSPTGEYHVGHIRTVLYDYALAKKNNGKFIIRIEDTDQKRFIEGSTDRILDVIKDYGLNWDEGPRVGGPHEPYFQSQRLAIYKKYAFELVEKRAAYYCFCSEDRLEKLREEQQANGAAVTKYDRHCLNIHTDEIARKLASGEKYVIRLKVPDNEIIAFTDAVLGEISFNSKDVDDQVLLKSDGFPTYQLAVVIDDHLMEISHILRGNDWIPSTPKHILVYKAFGWEVPVHAHLPNLKEKDGSKKLSKRFGAVSAAGFLEEGYLPEALWNFLMFLGWNPGTEKEIYSLDEFVQDFSLERLQKTDLVAFDRDRLLWMNGHYIRSRSASALWEIIRAWAQKYVTSLPSSDNILTIVELVKERMRTLSEFKSLTHYFFENPSVDRELLVKQTKDAEFTKAILTNYISFYESMAEDTWKKEFLDSASHSKLVEFGYRPKEAFMTIRVAVTGETATPPLFDVLEVLGKKTTLTRLRFALNLYPH